MEEEKIVIKKGGRGEEAFDEGKIRKSIEGAARDANVESEDLIGKVSDAVRGLFEGREKATSEEIRGKILEELESSAPAIAAAWKDYESKKVK